MLTQPSQQYTHHNLLLRCPDQCRARHHRSNLQSPVRCAAASTGGPPAIKAQGVRLQYGSKKASSLSLFQPCTCQLVGACVETLKLAICHSTVQLGSLKRYRYHMPTPCRYLVILWPRAPCQVTHLQRTPNNHLHPDRHRNEQLVCMSVPPHVCSRPCFATQSYHPLLPFPMTQITCCPRVSRAAGSEPGGTCSQPTLSC